LTLPRTKSARCLDDFVVASIIFPCNVKSENGIDIRRIANNVPLLLPVTINATLSAYGVADAMELRAFGAKKERTWYRAVRFRHVDYLAVVPMGCCIALA
jgi:energy-coupling factor transporter transmembrane protein EcfT